VDPSLDPNRRFRLFDAMVLIAALAPGLVMGQCYVRCFTVLANLVSTERINVRVMGPREWAYACVPMLVMLTLALGPMGLVVPRSRFLRRARRPGLIPGYVAALGLAAALVRTVHDRLTSFAITHYADVGILGPGETFSLRVVAAKNMIGAGVALSWLILWLGGGWRPGRTWIDRTGRVLGWLWIVGGLAMWVDGLFGW
jgi:hypothetical protein